MLSKDLVMANVQNETERESDEDCEVYFLKPVNEYNIMDKIKEANKELFSDEAGEGIGLMLDTQQNRKVSFAPNLEEYEPNNGITLTELENKLGKDGIENNENPQKVLIDHKLEIITEEAINENENNETCETVALEELQQEGENSFKTSMKNYECEEILNTPEQKSSIDENVVLEEICEEILILDIEGDKVEDINNSKLDIPSATQRKMLKQITFDCTEDDDELDNKSLTNLLISDSENDSTNDEVDKQEYNCNESISDDSDTEDKGLLTNSEYYDDDEEDDKLSIIVASYLPDDMACDNTSLTLLNSIKTSPRISKPRKRFSLRRKTKSSNAIGCCSNHNASGSCRFMPPPEVTDLKLHYKTCCEFKNAQQKLPNYTGYLSEYGLSREQLVQRALKLQEKQQVKITGKCKASEAERRKMHDNERAFTTWLRNKLRFPINKTKNMFDVNRPFGLRKCISLGGNALSDDTKRILNAPQYRSISAKLKKV